MFNGFEPIYYLMNIVAALTADRRRAQFCITALLLLVPLSSIPTVFASLQARSLLRGGFYAQRVSVAILAFGRVAGRVGFYIRCSALYVMQAGANLTHILELTFKQQIFIQHYFIVDYFYQNEFFKSKNFKFVDNPFKS